jgi:hypothetical protein
MYVRKEHIPSTAAKKKRTERFNVRLSEREARLIRLGAEQLGMTGIELTREPFSNWGAIPRARRPARLAVDKREARKGL